MSGTRRQFGGVLLPQFLGEFVFLTEVLANFLDMVEVVGESGVDLAQAQLELPGNLVRGPAEALRPSSHIEDSHARAVDARTAAARAGSLDDIGVGFGLHNPIVTASTPVWEGG